MTDLQPDYFERPLADVDPEVAEAIGRELERQQRTLEMIASENFVPEAVLECQGSVLTNKYAEGYPGKRYYGGCEHVDVIEQLAIDRAKALFGAEHANVQPHAGAQANASVYHALLAAGRHDHGPRAAARRPPHARHEDQRVGPALRHRAVRGLAREHRIDMDEVARIARERRPKLLLAGWSAYPRILDFARFREIADEVGALLMVDMAHFAGLVAAGVHPNPVPYADVVTTHRAQDARRRPRRADPVPRGVREEDQLGRLPRPAGRPAGARDRGQGGRAQDRRLGRSSASARSARWRAPRRSPTSCWAPATASTCSPAGPTCTSCSSTCATPSSTAMQAEDRLHDIGITVNRNAVPFDPRPPAVSSGLRVGASALATRGLQVDDFTEIGRIIATALQPGFEDAQRRAGRARHGDRRPPSALRAPGRRARPRSDARRRGEPASRGREQRRPRAARAPRRPRRRGRAVRRARARGSASTSAGRAPPARAAASGAGARTSCGQRTRRVARSLRAPAARAERRRAGERVWSVAPSPKTSAGGPTRRADGTARAPCRRPSRSPSHARGASERPGDAEVDQPRRRAHDDVRGLDVEVHPALGRHVVQRRGDVHRERQQLLERQRRPAAISSRSVGPSRCSISRCG